MKKKENGIRSGKKTATIIILIVILICLFTLAFKIQSAEAVDWWTMFHHDLNHTGYSTSTAPDTNELFWTYETPPYYNGVKGSSAIAYGKVYVGSDNDQIYCLDALTGIKIWSYNTGDNVNSSPAVVDGKVYVGSRNNKVYCLNAETGAFIWSYTTGDQVFSSPAVVNGKVYIGSFDNKVYCLNAETGDSIWTYTTGSYVWSSPAVADGKVYVGSHDFKVYCLDASTGAKIWSYNTNDCVKSSPAIANGKVYVGSYNNNVYCLNAETGTFIWSYTTGHDVQSSPAVAYGKVYVGSWDNKVYCLNAETGAFIWSYTTGDWVESSPAVADGRVYVGSNDDSLYCLNASTGAKIWSYNTGGNVYSSAAIANGIVCVGTWNIYVELYAFARTCTLTISATAGGITNPTTGTHSCPYISSIEVTAIPDSCYFFDHWELDGDNVGSANPCSILMDGDHTLHAVFIHINYDLTITTTVGGTTNPTPGIHTYPCSSAISVEVTAIPNTCYLFDHWDLNGFNVGSTNPYSIFMDDDYTLHSVFIVDIHDVASTNISVSDSIVCPGCSTSVNTTVENEGDHTETFNLTLYYDTSIIQTRTVTDLPSAQDTTILFSWNTTGIEPGDYSITAYAHTVLCETDTTDNTYTDGIVRIVPCGDCSADGNVDITDAVYLVNYLFKNGPDPVPSVCVGDANGDGEVTIADVVYLVNYVLKSGTPPVDNCCAI